MCLSPRNLAIVISEKQIAGAANAAVTSTHQVFEAELRSGEKFIVDLSCAQYGWHETVSLASDYVVTRCAQALKIGTPGGTCNLSHAFRDFQPPDSVETSSYKLKMEAISAMNGRMQEFESQCRQRGEAPLTRSTVDEFVSRLLPIAESATN